MFICECCKELFEETEMVDDNFCFECGTSTEIENCDNCDCLELKSKIEEGLCREYQSLPVEQFYGVYRR